jgi:cysteinyl-tRNA synthetase
MLSAHYRSIYNFTFADVESSRKGRIRIQEYIYSVWDKLDGNEVNSEIDYTTVISKLILDVWENLTNDFHTPKGLAATYKIINNVKVSELSESDLLNLAGFFVKFNAIFGVFELTTTPEVKLEIPAEVELLAKERFEAKLAKNWALSDKLRAEIDALGFIIKDSKEGYTVEKK